MELKKDGSKNRCSASYLVCYSRTRLNMWKYCCLRAVYPGIIIPGYPVLDIITSPLVFRTRKGDELRYVPKNDGR